MSRTAIIAVLPMDRDAFRASIGPNRTLMEQGYIFVYQDVRGRWNSEGVYDNMRAYIPGKRKSKLMRPLIPMIR